MHVHVKTDKMKQNMSSQSALWAQSCQLWRLLRQVIRPKWTLA